MLPSQTRHLMCQSKTVVLPSPLPLFRHMRRRVTREEGTTSFSFALLNLPFLIENSKPLLVQRPDRRLLICSGSKIYLLPLLPVSILIDSLLPSRKPLVRPLLCCIFCSSASVCLLRIAGVRRWFPISMSAPGFGRPIWLVQLSLLEAPAVVRLRTPRPPISHSQSIFLFHISFSFARPFLSSALRLVTLFDWTRWLRALFGRNPVRREPSLIDSLHQVIASNPLLSLGVKGRVPFLSCPKTFLILIGERLSLYFIWQGRRIPLYQ